MHPINGVRTRLGEGAFGGVYELELGGQRAAEPEAHRRAEAEVEAEEVHRSRAAAAEEEGVEAAWSKCVTKLTL